MVSVTSLFIVAESALGLSFGVRALTEIKIWYVECLYMLKVLMRTQVTTIIGQCQVKRHWPLHSFTRLLMRFMTNQPGQLLVNEIHCLFKLELSLGRCTQRHRAQFNLH